MRVIKGYFFACFAVSLALTLFLLLHAFDLDDHLSRLAAPFILFLFHFLFTFLFSIVPFSITLIVSEAFSVRSIWFYILAGVSTGFFVIHFLGDKTSFINSDAFLFPSVGLIGGLVYWFNSGRYAGGGSWFTIVPGHAQLTVDRQSDDPPQH